MSLTSLDIVNVSDAYLDEIEAGLDDTVPAYVPYLIRALRRARHEIRLRQKVYGHLRRMTSTQAVSR